MRGERVKVSESCTLTREREIRAGARRGKSRLHRERGQIPKRGKARKKSLPRSGRRKRVRVSGRKSSLGFDLQNLGFTPSLAKPEMGKKVGRRRARS